MSIVVIGGGAAGFFGAIAIKEAAPTLSVILLEKTAQLLAKVRVSGGGRCNVTHACFDPAKLILNYPRGAKELRGAFTRFQPQDTIEWFKNHGVELKVEKDGRMFPISNSSETIIQCFMKAVKESGVEIRTGMSVERVERGSAGFLIHIHDQQPIECQKILLATGSSRKIYEILLQLGHTIVEPLPSLFTFNVPTSPLLELSGIAVEKAELRILGLKQTGPLLLTHWGFSGPAALKLSAFGAQELAHCDYKTELSINWLPERTFEEVQKALLQLRSDLSTKPLSSYCPFSFPKNLWKKFLLLCDINPEDPYGRLSNKHIAKLTEKLIKDRYAVDGKTTYKEEFVTCGGVDLAEVDCKTMESRKVKGLYFAGEVLNIDGITGGFNFQSAWTTSWIAAHQMIQKE
ncbi:MAG: hypothetical protein JWO53_1037 [Chlamydiia bacterium]|nr:hypothetical protein [Chlamydiia bacterium]